MNEPICFQKGECFAKRPGERFSACTALATTYRVGEQCPFQKPHREITNGKEYPWDPQYGEK